MGGKIPRGEMQQQQQEGAKLLPAESSVPLFIFQARRIMMPSPPMVKKVARPQDGKMEKLLKNFLISFHNFQKNVF